MADPLAAVLLRNRVFPVTIASKPTNYGWIEVQPYIDFSLVDKIDTGQVQTDNADRSIFDLKTTAAIRIDQFLDSPALIALYNQGYQVEKPRAQIIYQFLRLGYTIRTPWPWLKLTYGMALGYHYVNFDFYFTRGDNSTRLSFFNANEEYIGLLRFASLALFEGENLNVMKLLVLTQDKVAITNPDRDLTLSQLLLSLEFLSWSFYF
ncbi:hypothetical protein KKI24_28145 [bacterium]|nr:hypothetical protein [bacterium]